MREPVVPLGSEESLLNLGGGKREKEGGMWVGWDVVYIYTYLLAQTRNVLFALVAEGPAVLLGRVVFEVGRVLG